MGRLLIGAGILLIIVGLAATWLGQLPGDIRWKGKYGTFYFPVVTCLAISAILSLISWLFRSR